MFEGILKNLKNLLKDDDEASDTLAGHYGMKDKDFNSLKNEIIAAMITNENFSTVIDKFFPNLNVENRVKVFAFACAFSDYYDFKESRKAMSDD